MVIKEGYKQTEIVMIPKDWEVKSFKEVSYMKGRIGWQGLNQTEFTMNSNEPFLITGMNFKNGAIRWDEVYHISEERYEIAKDIQLKDDDVLMTKDGTIGKLLYVENIPYPYKASLNSHLLVFRPLKNSYNPKYLYYNLLSPYFFKHIELTKSGTTFFGISQTSVGEYKIILPPLSEQTAIATALSDADGLITGLEKLIAKKRNIKQGAMQQLLQPKEGWEVKKLGDIISEIADGGTPPTSNNNYFGGEIYWVVIDDIKEEIFTTKQTLTREGLLNSSARLWQPETIILSTGATIGEVGIAKIPLATKQGICGIVVKDDVSNLFLKYWLIKNKKLILSLAQGSSIKEVRPPTLVKFEIIIPKTKEEQTRIATILSDMDAELSALVQKLEKYKKVKLGMMQELLTGKTRLV